MAHSPKGNRGVGLKLVEIPKMKSYARWDSGDLSSARLSSGVENMTKGEDSIRIKLSNHNAWLSFYENETEMIITNRGRCLFPVLKFSIEGLKNDEMYSLGVDFIPKDNCRYHYSSCGWTQSTEKKALPVTKMCLVSHRPVPGSSFNSKVTSVSKLKLTNNLVTAQDDKVVHLDSFRKYVARVHVIGYDRILDNIVVLKSEVFPVTEFVAVTYYRNPRIKVLKRQMNPFARNISQSEGSVISNETRSVEDEDFDDTETLPSRKSSRSSFGYGDNSLLKLGQNEAPSMISCSDTNTTDLNCLSEFESLRSTTLTNDYERCKSMAGIREEPSVCSDEMFVDNINELNNEQVKVCDDHTQRLLRLNNHNAPDSNDDLIARLFDRGSV
eukprot:Nk52_evm3s246 gene=Nk52_evmTU3s246